MKITVITNEVKFKIPLPVFVILNRFTLRILVKCISKYTNIPLNISMCHIRALSSGIKQAKKTLRYYDIPLIDVKSSDGSIVKITF